MKDFQNSALKGDVLFFDDFFLTEGEFYCILKKMIRKKVKKMKLLLFPCKENDYKPFLLKGNFLFYYFLFLFVLRIAVLPFFFYFPHNVFFAQVVSSSLIELTNKEREFLGLSSLKENAQLEKAAFLKAQDMLANDYFGHNSPQGISGWHWIKEAGYNYKIAGENLAIGFLDSGEVHKAWKDSWSHRKNILDPRFQDIGIAVLKGDFQGHPTTLVVQLFGVPKFEEVLREEIIPTARAEELIPQTEESLLPEEEVLQAGTTEEENVEGQELAEKQVVIRAEDKEEKPSFQFNFLEFMEKDYNLVVERITFYSLIIMAIILISEIFVLLSGFFHKKLNLKLFLDLILKPLFFVGISVLLFLFNQQVAIYFIPHHLRIYGI